MRSIGVVGVALAVLCATGARAQTVGPALDVAPPGESPSSPNLRAMATSGTDYLVFYSDEGVGPDEMTATRLAADGSSSTDLPLAMHRTNSVACNATWCLGAWAETATMSPWRTDVLIQRFRPDGSLIDASPILVDSLADAVGAGVYVDYADGEVFGLSVAAQYPIPVSPTYRAIDFRVVDGTTIGDPVEIALPTGASPLNVACIRGMCLVGWVASGRDYFVRVSTTGGATIVDDPALDVLSGDPRSLARVGDDEWAVFGFVSRRIGRDGGLGSAVTVPPAYLHDCTAGGNCYVVTFGLGVGGIRLAQWYGIDVWRNIDTVPLSLGVSLFACVGDDDCALVDSSPAAASRIRVSAVDATATLSPMPAFGFAPTNQIGPLQVVPSSTGTLVLFQDRPSFSEQRLLAARMGPDGRPDGSEAVVVLSGPLRNDEWFHAAPVSGGFFVVYWDSLGTTSLQRLDPSGAPVGTPIALSALDRPQLLTRGDEVLLVTGSSFQRLNALGERIDPTPRPFFPPGYGGFVTLVPQESGWLALLRDEIGALRGARIDDAGEPIDLPPGFLIRDSRTLLRPGLVQTSEGAVAVWAEGEFDGPYEIRAARLVGGASLDVGGRTLATTTSLDSLAAVGLGSRLAVTWSGSTNPPIGRVGLYRSATLDPIGSELDLGCGASCREVDIGGTPVIIAMEGGRGRSARMRVAVTRLFDDTLGAGCAVDSDCASGFCTDGVCCDGRCDGVCDSCSVEGLCRSEGTACDVGVGADVGVEPDGGIDSGLSEADAGTSVTTSGCACTVHTTRTPKASLLVIALIVLLAARHGRRLMRS